MRRRRRSPRCARRRAAAPAAARCARPRRPRWRGSRQPDDGLPVAHRHDRRFPRPDRQPVRQDSRTSEPFHDRGGDVAVRDRRPGEMTRASPRQRRGGPLGSSSGSSPTIPRERPRRPRRPRWQRRWRRSRRARGPGPGVRRPERPRHRSRGSRSAAAPERRPAPGRAPPGRQVAGSRRVPAASAVAPARTSSPGRARSRPPGPGQHLDLVAVQVGLLEHHHGRQRRAGASPGVDAHGLERPHRQRRDRAHQHLAGEPQVGRRGLTGTQRVAPRTRSRP